MSQEENLSTEYDLEEKLLSRTRHIIYLAPEASFNDLLTKKINRYNIKNKIIEQNKKSLEFHTTILGFYSEYSKLGIDSAESLESQIVENFDQLPTLIKEPVLIKDLALYGSDLVLELCSEEIKKIHYDALSMFKSLIVLKGGILPADDEDYFNQRYRFSGSDFSPHLSLIKSYPKKNIPYRSFDDLIKPSKSFYFDRLVLARKEDFNWKILTSRYL